MKIKRILVQKSKNLARSALRPIVRAYDGSQPSLQPERWGLQRLDGRGLGLEGIPLHELLSRWGSPLHVVSAAALRENTRSFLAVPEGREFGCEVFYSYKTNPVPGVLKFLHELGVGAEVISPYEFWLARRLGMPPSRIVYNGPAKSVESIREAIDIGIELLNVNHREEVALVARLAAEAQKRVRVGIRVNVGQGWSAQFGIPIDDGQALAAYREALASPFLDVVGIHVHRGGMIRRVEATHSFVDALLAFTDVLQSELALTLKIVNFGGSLGTPTVHALTQREWKLNQSLHRHPSVPEADAALSIREHVSAIVGRVEEHYRSRGFPRPRIMLEPGRAMTGNTQMLVTSMVTSKAARDISYAIMDAGINLAESCRSEYHQVFPVNRYGEPADRVYTLVGPICSPGDTLYPALRLPTLTPGDSLVIMDSGAYFVPFATSFSFPQPAIVLVDEGRDTLLRRAERFDDLVVYDG